MSFQWGTSLKIKILVLCHHLFFIIGLLFFDAKHLAVALLSYFIFGKIGGEIALHRYFSHKSFKTTPAVDKFLRLVSIGAGLGSPISWAATHRLHHRHEDSVGDPHSPRLQSPWNVWLTYWKPFVVPQKLISDLSKDPLHRMIHNHYFLLHIALWIPSLILFPTYFPYIFSFPCIYGFHLAGAVNVLGHSPEIRNVLWLNFFGLGDALHLNHHKHPNASSTAGANLLEFDLSGWIIRTFCRVDK